MGTAAGVGHRSETQRECGIRDAGQEQRGLVTMTAMFAWTQLTPRGLLFIVEEAIHTLSQVESIFNVKYEEPYTYVFLNDEPFEEEFIRRTTVCAFELGSSYVA